jgi:hypothetical protein
LDILRWAALITRFLLELAALIAFSYWGITRGTQPVIRVALAVAAPLVVILIWAALIAPNASVPWSQQVRNVLGLTVFLGAAAALYSTGRDTLGWFVAVVAVFDTAILMWGRW